MDHSQSYETLDPENWDDMGALAHRMVDDAITYLQTARERPVWQPMPEEVTAVFDEKAPHEPAGAEAAYQEFAENILPYPMGTYHPRFWAWYMGNGTVTGALADFLAGIMNSNLGGGNHSANLVEAQVVAIAVVAIVLEEGNLFRTEAIDDPPDHCGLARARPAGHSDHK